MKIGILTGGGDCPGLNPVIRAVTRKAIHEGDEVIGIRHGWKGLLLFWVEATLSFVGSVLSGQAFSS